VSGALRVGCAGWTLPREHRAGFPAEGSHLERYAARFPAVEINSTFHRPHRRATFERWAASVPPSFRFAVKLPKTITHRQRLADTEALVDDFLASASGLGDRLGPLLVQLPPSLELDEDVARAFFTHLRARHAGDVVCEPRHPSWFEDAGERLLAELRIARVAADPARVPTAAEPGGWPGLAYYRLHGSPRIYYSSYDDAYLDALAARLARHAAEGRDAWCIFDNTASGAAAGDALALMRKLHLEGE
jgi:uncharacterized protein YecE (DUF72 family)